jgi:hypothetical protein
MNEWIQWAVDVFRDDARLYFAPLKGAVKGAIAEVRMELNRPRRRMPSEVREQEAAALTERSAS